MSRRGPPAALPIERRENEPPGSVQAKNAPGRRAGQTQQTYRNIVAGYPSGDKSWPYVEIHQQSAAGSRHSDLIYHQLVVYVGRLRRANAIERDETGDGPKRTGQILKPSVKTALDECEGAARDPLANIKDRLIHNRPRFNFDDHPPDKKKLIG